MIASQEQLAELAEAAGQSVQVDTWALQEARLLESLRQAGLQDGEAAFVITGDDARFERFEVI